MTNPKRASSTAVLILSMSVAILIPRLSGAESGWTTSTWQDEMTGEKSAEAKSEVASPTRRMDFPYGDVEAVFGLNCTGDREATWIAFSVSPNLNSAEWEDGYQVIRTRMKWDGNIRNVTFMQPSGSKLLQFWEGLRGGRSVSRMIEKSNPDGKVLVELDWHGQGRVHFEFSLTGATKAIADMREKCGNSNK